jgi:hypothetical protein
MTTAVNPDVWGQEMKSADETLADVLRRHDADVTAAAEVDRQAGIERAAYFARKDAALDDERGAKGDLRRLLAALGRDPSERMTINYIPLAGGWESKPTTVAEAPALADKYGDLDCYFGSQRIREIKFGRGYATDVIGLRSLNCDLDVKAGGMPSWDAARGVIDTLTELLGVAPVGIVNSGHGLQPHWALEPGEGTDWTDEKDPRWLDAVALWNRWGRLVAHIAAQWGGNADGVFDLARVMRVPGTINRKKDDDGYPASVGTSLELTYGAPVSLDQLRDLLDDRGIVEQPKDRMVAGEIQSAAGTWEWADVTCPVAEAMIAGWSTDPIVGGRHPWLNGQAIRLAAAHRSGCLTEKDHKDAANALAKAFRSALAKSPVRQETPDEIASTIKWGVRAVEGKPTADEAATHAHIPFTPFIARGADGKDRFTAGESAGEVIVDAETAFWESRSVLAHVRDHARSLRVAPWAVLVSVLLDVNAAIEPNVVLPRIIGGYGSLNTFGAFVGKSGAGKGTAGEAGRAAVNLQYTDGSKPDTFKTGIGSGEGIGHQYKRLIPPRPIGKKTGADFSAPDVPAKVEYETVRTRVLFDSNEVDKFFALGGRSGATLGSTVREMFSGEGLGQAYVNEAKRLPVDAHSYRACLSLGVQPKRAQALMDEADGGTPQRFVWANCLDPDAPDDLPEMPEPRKVELPKFKPNRDDGRHVLFVCQTARQVIDAERLIVLRGGGDDLDAHGRYVQLKVAAAVGALDGHEGIRSDDWRIAEAIMAHSKAVRESVIEKLATEKAAANIGAGKAAAVREITTDDLKAKAAVEKVTKWFLRRLSEDGGWVPRGKLRAAASKGNLDVLPEALDRAVVAGTIEVKDGGTPERPQGHLYRRAPGGANLRVVS